MAETLAAAADEAPPCSEPQDVALLQYTSGSTGNPKGVVLTHANLLANIRAMGEALQVSSGDVVVSWLPLYHDMGLIGAWLGSLCFAMPAAIMPPSAFLARPRSWLWALQRYKATITTAPNFAYEMCLRQLEAADLEGLNLSSVRLMLNGAEAVSPQTVRAFASRYAAYGLRATALTPVYGLAECAVGLAFPSLGRGPVIDGGCGRRRRHIGQGTRPVGAPGHHAIGEIGLPADEAQRLGRQVFPIAIDLLRQQPRLRLRRLRLVAREPGDGRRGDQHDQRHGDGDAEKTLGLDRANAQSRR